ncbi:MAG: ATP synthase F1 subunit epsilon [Bacillota bacterium]|nr:ATP synthase F1 subunit epsilon [Bacillota bacterium]
MDKTFHFQITTADGAIADVQASYATVPLTDGEAGILPSHAAMIAALKEGVVRYTVEGKDNYAAVSGGVLSIADDEVIILARSAELAENIDLARAQSAEKRARERIESKSSEWDMKRAEYSLQRAIIREKVYNMINH